MLANPRFELDLEVAKWLEGVSAGATFREDERLMRPRDKEKLRASIFTKFQ